MISSDPEFQQLLHVSAEIGADPSLVQGAGGNTSIKLNDVLCIKASGTWLMNAGKQDIMVPVKLPELRHAIERNDISAERAEAFVIQSKNPRQLRPSIETTVHALFPQKVVVHVHCVDTISIAIKNNAEQILTSLLAEFNWRYVPYVKPGLSLSQAIAKNLYNNENVPADVVVLGNHGLVVAGNSVDAAQNLLKRVCNALKQPVREAPECKREQLELLSKQSDYALPDSPQAHAVALDSQSTGIAAGGSLYPDHVIFLGEGSVIAKAGETPADVAERYQHEGMPEPVSILFPGIGVLMKKDISAGAHAMAQCLSDVCARVTEPDAVNYLSPEQNDELINWDAEKYRQALNNDSK